MSFLLKCHSSQESFSLFHSKVLKYFDEYFWISEKLTMSFLLKCHSSQESFSLFHSKVLKYFDEYFWISEKLKRDTFIIGQMVSIIIL